MTSYIKCPICGSDTTLRTAKKGPDAGEKFYVCNRYPECKGRVSVKQDSIPKENNSLSLNKLDVTNSKDEEKTLKARGVKFYFIVKQDIPKNDIPTWTYSLRSSPLSKYYRLVDFTYTSSKTEKQSKLITGWQEWNLIKIFCLNSQSFLVPSEVKPFYNKLFRDFNEWFTEFCERKGFESKAYDFRILFRLNPPEGVSAFVPIPSLEDISKYIVSPPAFLPKRPMTYTEMIDFGKQLAPDRVIDAMLQWSEKDNHRVYSSYGIRDDKTTGEMDIQLNTITDALGKFWYELIFETRQSQQPESVFERYLNSLLEQLFRKGLIDTKLLDDIKQNPTNYFERGEIGSRFRLNLGNSYEHTSEYGNNLNIVKKDFQKSLQTYDGNYLYGAAFYKPIDEELDRIEEITKDIIYFQRAKDKIFVNLTISLTAPTYDEIVGIAIEINKILESCKIREPRQAINIEDARKRWNAAILDFEIDNKKVKGFIVSTIVSGIPLQIFKDGKEFLYEKLNNIAIKRYQEGAPPPLGIDAVITTDDWPRSAYGCYVYCL